MNNINKKYILIIESSILPHTITLTLITNTNLYEFNILSQKSTNLKFTRNISSYPTVVYFLTPKTVPCHCCYELQLLLQSSFLLSFPVQGRGEFVQVKTHRYIYYRYCLYLPFPGNVSINVRLFLVFLILILNEVKRYFRDKLFKKKTKLSNVSAIKKIVYNLRYTGKNNQNLGICKLSNSVTGG